jgi:hypothetical protein
VQIHRMIDAGDEGFDAAPLPGGSGWTGEQDGLLSMAVGPYTSFGDLNWGAVGRLAEHDCDECARRWLVLSAAHDVEPDYSPWSTKRVTTRSLRILLMRRTRRTSASVASTMAGSLVPLRGGAG